MINKLILNGYNIMYFQGINIIINYMSRIITLYVNICGLFDFDIILKIYRRYTNLNENIMIICV